MYTHDVVFLPVITPCRTKVKTSNFDSSLHFCKSFSWQIYTTGTPHSPYMLDSGEFTIQIVSKEGRWLLHRANKGCMLLNEEWIWGNSGSDVTHSLGSIKAEHLLISCVAVV
jgi:hypothetical protein